MPIQRTRRFPLSLAPCSLWRHGSKRSKNLPFTTIDVFADTRTQLEEAHSKVKSLSIKCTEEFDVQIAKSCELEQLLIEKDGVLHATDAVVRAEVSLKSADPQYTEKLIFLQAPGDLIAS